jgi:hypothetical protein
MAWQGPAGTEWVGVATCIMAGKAGSGMVRHGPARQARDGPEWSGLAGEARHGEVRRGLARLGRHRVTTR